MIALRRLIDLSAGTAITACVLLTVTFASMPAVSRSLLESP